MTMRVGVNAALMSSSRDYRQAGVSRYVAELLAAIAPLTSPDEQVIPVRPGHPRLWSRPEARIAWEQTALAIRARAARLDLLHGPVMVAPVIGPPSVVTVHDLAFVRYPEHAPLTRRVYLTPATRMSVARARRIITVSEATASDLIRWAGVPAAKIEAIPLAAATSIRPPEQDRSENFRRTSVHRPYVLAVGTIEPRKNLRTLLRAFASIVDRVPHDLVVVGGDGWKRGSLAAELETRGISSRVRFTGHVDDDELSCWYSASDCFVFPSMFEGFGLPPLEAMQCGAPVITTTASSLPEVVGDAAITVEPYDADAFAAAIRRVVTNESLRAEMREQGLARAASFTWSRTASSTLDVYRDALTRG